MLLYSQYKALFLKLHQLLTANHTVLTLFPHIYTLSSSGNPIIKQAGVHLCKYLNRVTLFQIQKFLVGEMHQSNTFWIQKNAAFMNWSNEYVLVPSNIPPPLTISLCRRFLFISSVLRVLERKGDSGDQLQATNCSREWYVQLQSLSDNNLPSSFANQLEVVITKMYHQITVYLWSILCAHDVRGLFYDLRRCFLLDDDVFQTWLSSGAMHVLQQNTSLFIDASNDLSKLFQRIENEYSCMDNVSICIASANKISMTTTGANIASPQSQSSSYSQLLDQISKLREQWHDHLHVKAQVKWPLDLLISEEISEIYNQIWQFLLLIKRVQMELNDCYMTLMKTNKQARTRSHQQQLHMIMHFLVDHIWYYLGVDVIDAQFSNFAKFLSTCESFQACKVQHEQFLMRIHKSMFLGKAGQVVRTTLLKLLDVILSFTHVVRTEQIDNHLTEIDNHWKRQMSLFWTLLENGADREVSVLCLRVDFNGWFSKSGE